MVSEEKIHSRPYLSCLFFIIVYIGMTLISCARLNHLPGSSPLSVTTPEATPPRFSAIPADFLQHSADFLQNLQIFCNTLQIFCNSCRFSTIPADFLQYLQIFCNILRIFCNTYRFSAIPADFLQHSADFLQYMQIFCNTCKFSATLCGFSAIHADFLQYLQIFCNTRRFSATLPNFCGASSDDINICTAQRSSVVPLPWLLMVFSACLQIYPNFTRSQPRAYYVTSMLLLSSTKTRVDASKITLPIKKQDKFPNGIEFGEASRFKAPSSTLIVGPSGCGKTCFNKSLPLDHLEELFVKPPPTIHYCYGV